MQENKNTKQRIKHKHREKRVKKQICKDEKNERSAGEKSKR